MSEIFISRQIEQQIQQLGKLGGAFLTVQHGDKLNTMTIGWGSIGFIWSRPIFMVAVRPERYTYELLEQAREFSVTIPHNDNLKEALALCGSKSGRDLDKFATAGLTTIPAKTIATPIIADHAWQYECRVIFRQEMSANELQASPLGERFYQPQHGSAHVLYFGEIAASYLTEATS